MENLFSDYWRDYVNVEDSCPFDSKPEDSPATTRDTTPTSPIKSVMLVDIHKTESTTQLPVVSTAPVPRSLDLKNTPDQLMLMGFMYKRLNSLDIMVREMLTTLKGSISQKTKNKLSYLQGTIVQSFYYCFQHKTIRHYSQPDQIVTYKCFECYLHNILNDLIKVD